MPTKKGKSRSIDKYVARPKQIKKGIARVSLGEQNLVDSSWTPEKRAATFALAAEAMERDYFTTVSGAFWVDPEIGVEASQKKFLGQTEN